MLVTQRLIVTPQTVAHQAPLSMGFSRHEYWSGLSFLSPEDVSHPGIKPVSLNLLHWQTGSLLLLPPGKPSYWLKKKKSIRTKYGATDWFKVGKGVHQGCILSPCLFNLYAEYIMRSPGLEKAQLESRLLGEISITLVSGFLALGE